jgi:hypothetical protein
VASGHADPKILWEVNMDILYIGLGVVFLVLSIGLVSGFEKLRRPK